MLKERLNLSLNEEGARALAQIVARTGLSRTAVIEAVLIETASRVPDQAPKFLGAILPDGSEQVRADRKAARIERKAELAQAVTAALPARSADEILASAQAKLEKRSYCPVHRPKWCPDDCKHRVET